MSKAIPRTADPAALLEEKILRLLKNNPEGLANEVILDEIGEGDANQIVTALNGLLKQHRVRMFQDPANPETIIWREVAKEAAQKLKGLTAEDLLIYDQIKNAGSNGIWTRDMRTRTNLQAPQVTKILKTLEARKLVKAVRSVHNGNKKVYMLFDEEPSKEITGGAWYTESEFDVEFIKVLRDACLRHIRKVQRATLEDVLKFIESVGVAKVSLSPQDLSMILNTLLLDGLIEVVEEGGEDDVDYEVYRPARSLPPVDIALTTVPCGICPIIHECTPGGLISPETCEYYTQYLEEW